MLDPVLAREAMRLRVASVVVVTTGLINDLYAAADGFHRNTGSFITDGFADGMEVTATGFNSNNNAATTGKMIRGKVLAGFLPISGGLDVQSVSAGRSIFVGIPKDRRWENTLPANVAAVGTRPFISDAWGSVVDSFLAGPVSGGHLEQTGAYYVTWFGLGDIGIPAIYRGVYAIKKLFAPGTKITAGSDVIRIGARGPTTSQLTPLENKMAFIQLSIPWRCASVNTVAA